jgi:hypothetical protein
LDNDHPKDPLDTFDDLFEPFDLEEGPPPKQRKGSGGGGPDDPEGPVPGPGYALPCPSCGTPNPPSNRHCEACGARLSQSGMPVAPQPMLRTTAGARALMVLAGVILTVAVLALIVNVFRGGGDATAESTSTTTTSVPVEIEALVPVRTTCTSELPSFPCTALTDNDPDNSWNATEGGVGAELTFLFSPPVQITELFIDNVQEEERFRRNARVKGVEITTDDLVQSTIVELEDTNAPQKIQVGSIRTSSLTITITSAYPGQTFEGKEPFRELAMQQITFYGRVSPDTAG